jgi:hypothetical protein
VTGRPGMARARRRRRARAKRARRLVHSALTRRRMECTKRQAGLCISLLRRELAHAQRPKFSGRRASRAALRASPSRSVATCRHRFCRLGIGIAPAQVRRFLLPPADPSTYPKIGGTTLSTHHRPSPIFVAHGIPPGPTPPIYRVGTAMMEMGGEWESGRVGEEGEQGKGEGSLSTSLSLYPGRGSSWRVALGRTSQPNTTALASGKCVGVWGGGSERLRPSEPPLRAGDVPGSSWLLIFFLCLGALCAVPAPLLLASGWRRCNCICYCLAVYCQLSTVYVRCVVPCLYGVLCCLLGRPDGRRRPMAAAAARAGTHTPQTRI